VAFPSPGTSFPEPTLTECECPTKQSPGTKVTFVTAPMLEKHTYGASFSKLLREGKGIKIRS